MLNGTWINCCIAARQTFAFRWNSAPGNHAGMYFTRRARFSPQVGIANYDVLLTDWDRFDEECSGIHGSYGCFKATLDNSDKRIAFLHLDSISAVD